MPTIKALFDEEHRNGPPREGMLSEIDLKILWVARTLTNIEFRHCEDMLELERSLIEIEQKNYIKGQMLSKYHERQQPYLELLKQLKHQQSH
ncbi:MAG: hypothetical protein M3O00_13055 [Pseudomonadota bacterium]|jgi:hypothetical protein|nr:hypothetical protein [Pseudomonadota bacterium]